MRPPIKTKEKRGSARDLFGEVVEGMRALAEGRHGKRTLRTNENELKSASKFLAQKPLGNR